MPTLAQIKAMTDEEVRIALAETQGWVNLIQNTQDEWHFLNTRELEWVRGCTLAGRHVKFFPDGLHHPVPNYALSLDALQPIKEGLTYEQKEIFGRTLYDLSKCGILLCGESEDWLEIATIASEPASIQSRALLAALTE